MSLWILYAKHTISVPTSTKCDACRAVGDARAVVHRWSKQLLYIKSSPSHLTFEQIKIGQHPRIPGKLEIVQVLLPSGKNLELCLNFTNIYRALIKTIVFNIQYH